MLWVRCTVCDTRCDAVAGCCPECGCPLDIERAIDAVKETDQD